MAGIRVSQPSPSDRTTRPERTETVPPPGSDGARPDGARDGGELPRAEQVGRYSVLSHLGTGGMGSVYAAYDPDLDRKVALKLVRQDRASRAEQERLLHEARALARLAHPNVVRVYDCGLHGESVFFAMEFVSGLDLRRWLEAHRPGWRRIVTLFEGVGRGLAAAHVRGLIHRDLKPDNILVGDDGTARIADFGLVKRRLAADVGGNGSDGAVAAAGAAAARSRVGAETRAAMGTPAYMAPELAAGRAADERSDQYSFCVALYVALYGDYPPAGDSFSSGEARPGRGARGQRPVRGSVPQGLKKIVRRGLQSDPALRYPSMSALVDALARRSGRRRRGWAAAAVLGLVAVALAIGLVQRPVAAEPCSSGEERFAGVWDAGRRRALGEAFETSGSPYATEAFAGTAAALSDYRSQWLEAYREACVATRVRGEQSERMLDLRALCLERRREEVRALTDLLLAGGPEVVPMSVRASRSLSRIGACEADPEMTLLSALPEDPEERRQVERLQARLARQAVRAPAGQKVDLEEVESIVAAADRLGYGPLSARARRRLAMAQVLQEGDADAGVETLERALVDAVGGGDRPFAAVVYGHLAEYTGYNQGDPERGRWWGRFAEASLAGLGPGHQEERHRVHSALGLLAWTRGLTTEAEDHWRQALRYGSEAYGADSPLLAEPLNNLALIAESPDQGRRFLEQALELKERAYGRDNPLVANTLVNLGSTAAAAGRFREALPHARRAATIVETANGPEHPNLAYPVLLEGELLNVLDRPLEAADRLERAAALARGFGDRHPLQIQVEIDLADSMLRQLDAERAAEHLDRAAGLVSAFPETAPFRVAIPFLRGRLLLLRGEQAAARDALEEAWSLTEQTEMEPSINERIRLRVALAEAYLGLGQKARARDYLDQALELIALCDELPALGANARFLLAWAVEADDPQRALALARDAAGGLPPGGSASSRRLRAEIDAWLAAREGQLARPEALSAANRPPPGFQNNQPTSAP